LDPKQGSEHRLAVAWLGIILVPEHVVKADTGTAAGASVWYACLRLRSDRIGHRGASELLGLRMEVGLMADEGPL
jgi:hypothetical protein